MKVANLFFRSSVLGVADQLLRALMALFLTPLMVARLGGADFGMWVLLTGFFSQYILLDAGLTASLPHFLGQAIGRNDAAACREIVSTAALMLARVTLLGLGVTAVGWLVLPWFLHDVSRLAGARGVVIVFGIAMAAQTLAKIFVLDLNSRLRSDVVSAFGLLRVLICAPAAWLVLRHGGGVLDLAFVHGTGTVAEAIGIAAWNRALLADIHPRWSNKVVRREILRYSGWSYALTTSERLRGALDPFLLGWLRDSVSTGIYALGMRPVVMFYDVAYSLIGGQLLPAFSRLHAERRTKLLEKSFVMSSRVSALLAAFGGGWLIMVGPLFMRCWVPQEARAALPVLWCVAFSFVLYATQIPSVHLLYSRSQHRAVALVFMAGVIVNLMLSAVLIVKLGIVGAAVGTAVEMTIVYGAVLPWLVAQTMKKPVRWVFDHIVFRPLLRGLLIASPVAVALWLKPAWINVAAVTLGLGVWFIIAVATGLVGADEKKWFWRFARSRQTAVDAPDGGGWEV